MHGGAARQENSSSNSVAARLAYHPASTINRGLLIYVAALYTPLAAQLTAAKPWERRAAQARVGMVGQQRGQYGRS